MTPRGRAELVRRVQELGQPHSAVAADLGVGLKAAGKWLERLRAEGPARLEDRSSRQHRLRPVTLEAVCERSVVLRRAGLSRLHDLEPAAPVRRHEREHPGELIHIDIKKLGRFAMAGHRITPLSRPSHQ